MTAEIWIRQAEGTWVVRSGGAVLGESSAALELTEGDRDPVLYFPRSDIATAFLDRSQTTSHCPHKGTASYFSIVNRSSVTRDAVWSYEDPLPAMAAIKGYLAFVESDSVKVEQI